MLTKNDIVSIVAEATGETKAKALVIVDATINALKASLLKGDDVRLHDFGTFAVKASAARKARNPLTGAEIDVPAGRKLTFKPASTLKGAL